MWTPYCRATRACGSWSGTARLARWSSATLLSQKGQKHFDHRGMPEVTLHRFRHWFGTHLLMERELGGAGANLRVVQELMRHASIATTGVYTAVAEAQKVAAVRGLGVAA